MKKTAVTIAMAGLCLFAVQAGAEDGWVSLFDGKSFDGWKASENRDTWKIENGQLICHGPRSHLFYDGPLQPLKDFELKADVMTSPKANSGIYFHTRFQPVGWPLKGYEVQVNNTHQDPKKTGGLYGVADVYEAPAQDGKWFEMHIAVRGRHVVVKVDGKTVVDYTEPPNPQPAPGGFERIIGEGTIALQAHDPGSVVRYKNIRLKKLP